MSIDAQVLPGLLDWWADLINFVWCLIWGHIFKKNPISHTISPTTCTFALSHSSRFGETLNINPWFFLFWIWFWNILFGHEHRKLWHFFNHCNVENLVLWPKRIGHETDTVYIKSFPIFLLLKMQYIIKKKISLIVG